jgi:hypothetical protein
VNIGLVVNARGKICLVHDERFEGVPLWVGYHLDRRQIEIVYVSGKTYPIEWVASKAMHNFLAAITKILIIRMEDQAPVEGFDTSFLTVRGNRTCPPPAWSGKNVVRMSELGQVVVKLDSEAFNSLPQSGECNWHSGRLCFHWGSGQILQFSLTSGWQEEIVSRYELRVVLPNDQGGAFSDALIPVSLVFAQGEAPAAQAEWVSQSSGDDQLFDVQPAIEVNSAVTDITFQSLPLDEAQTFLELVAPATQFPRLSEGTMQVQVAALPFYDDFDLYAVSDTSLAPPKTSYLLYKPDSVHLMNWTNEPIFRVNKLAPIKLDHNSVISYVKFYFHYVRGRLGRFIIVENPEEMVWLPSATEKEKADVAAMLMPVTYRGTDGNMLFTITCTVLFNNALFRTDIKVAPCEMDVHNPEFGGPEHFAIGQTKLTNEELLLENLNVLIATPSGERG